MALPENVLDVNVKEFLQQSFLAGKKQILTEKKIIMICYYVCSVDEAQVDNFQEISIYSFYHQNGNMI